MNTPVSTTIEWEATVEALGELLMLVEADGGYSDEDDAIGPPSCNIQTRRRTNGEPVNGVSDIVSKHSLSGENHEARATESKYPDEWWVRRFSCDVGGEGSGDGIRGAR